MPDAPAKLDILRLPQVELAKLLSSPRLAVSPQRLVNWGRRGCPRNEDGSYNVVLVARWMQEQLAEKPRTRQEQSEEEKAYNIKIKREKYLKNRRERLRDEKMDKVEDRVRNDLMAAAARLSTAFLDRVRPLARAVAMQPEDQCAGIIEAAVRETLAGLTAPSQEQET